MKQYKYFKITPSFQIRLQKVTMQEGEYYEVPESVKEQAKIGLAMQHTHGKKTAKNRLKGIARAAQLIQSDVITRQDLTEIRNYHRRHEVDKNNPEFLNEGKPSNGRIAWQLWGSGKKDEAWKWAESMLTNKSRK